MNWYSANLITSFGHQDDADSCEILVWENVVLFQGKTADDMRQKAVQRGRDSVSVWTDVSFLPEGKPMVERFEGVKKIVRIDVPSSVDPVNVVPGGTRVARSLFEVSDSKTLTDLVNDKSCRIKSLGSRNQISETSNAAEHDLSTKASSINVPQQDSNIPSLWYSAHLLMSLHPTSNEQNDRIHVIEDTVLINASTVEEALSQAKYFGTITESLLCSMSIDGCLMKAEFVGIRKLVATDNNSSVLGYDIPPADETEVTFSEFEVVSASEVEKFLKDEDVILLYKASSPNSRN